MDKVRVITPEDFVIAWQTSKSIDEVLEKTGLNRESALNRVSRLRSKGVPLKKFPGVPPKGRPYDYNALKELAESLNSSEDKST